jgi:uncharacterized protein (TIGR02391 family)
MIPTDLHKEVHTALVRRRSVDLWGNSLNNGYVGLILCTHPDKDEIAINEVIEYFERNFTTYESLDDPKDLVGVALFSAILTRQGRISIARKTSELVNNRLSLLIKRENSKYSLLNRPELIYLLVLGLSLNGEENIHFFKKILTDSVQSNLVSVENILRTVFFLASGIELGMNLSTNLSEFINKLQISQLQTYDVIPLIWFLMKYREKIDGQLEAEPSLKERISHFAEMTWKQFEAYLPYLSLYPLGSMDEEVESTSMHVLSVLELTMLDDMLTTLELKEGMYPPDLYSMLRLHPVIKNKTEKLFREGNYNQAVSEAFMAIIDMVKEKANHPRGDNGKELDGTALIEQVFSPKNPLLKFNEMKDYVEIDEQRGLMELFRGAVLAVRNVFHHKSRAKQENPYDAIEYIQFASFLARKLDLATLAKKNS